MNWKTLEFDQLTARELYLIMRARSAVFVVERSHVHLDADGHDEHALHLFAVDDMTRQMPILAYARIRPCDSEEPDIAIDKILTSPGRRGDGTAHALIERALQVICKRWPGRAVWVTAPAGLSGFYEQFGFRKMDGRLLERGTPHISLRWQPRKGSRNLFAVQRRERESDTIVDSFEFL
ncbi:GNAT family N-acetyltransferase [Paraburkholderia sp. LEh10]|uniref:GNAT family N-acetyltransferase n=1 Tax=Paraburkholderia sp. LEh10 TaxID=2821353 RepID=UPI001AE30D05|nr:GNAT family N-acetyltransferase [Paraburkholderia sp. LEh10]MBP0589044.1 GNAT family N-acetyltransferase [Paraburkholderia sp. LEh10]